MLAKQIVCTSVAFFDGSSMAHNAQRKNRDIHRIDQSNRTIR